MKFDELQNAWQQQGEKEQITIDSNALLKLVRQNHKALARKHFVQSGALAVLFGLIYLPIWVWFGITRDLPWSWYLLIPGFLWVAVFLLKNRISQRKKRPQPGNSLRESVSHSLSEIDHQIELQKNVFWWYLLPPLLPTIIFFIHSGSLSRDFWGMAFHLIITTLIFWGTYEGFQFGVRKNLEPRRAELQEFLEALNQSNSKTNEDE